MSRFCILVIVCLAGLAMAEDAAPVTVDTARKQGVVCELQRHDGPTPSWTLRLSNRNDYGVRVDYRILSRETSPHSGTVIIRPAAAGVEKQAEALVQLPARGGWFGADIAGVARGTVREKHFTRIGADGVSEQITELELVETATPTQAEGNREKDLARAEEEAAQLRQELAALRREQQEERKQSADRAAAEQTSRELVHRRALLEHEWLRQAREREAERRRLVVPPPETTDDSKDYNSPVTTQPGFRAELENERRSRAGR